MADFQPQGGQGQVVSPETFRDSVGTMDSTGKRKWVFPRKPKGNYTNYRQLVSIFLLVLFFTLPFIKIDGNPLLLFNILERKFFLFGQPFFPQDFYLIAIGAITSIVFIIVFTVVFGRIFCGWICPQTIFMEMVFRKIEYAIEGDRNKQIKLDKQPWDAEKIRKRALKWFLFALVSLLISHTMFSYIVGINEVLRIMEEGPLAHPTNFIVMILFTAAFYFVFAWFREQVCTLVCPYGRLQGVLIDKQTINVYYDFQRGESRAKWKKGEDRAAEGKGDCIDCNQCVVVCPTNIDIRNGQQLECINCTACIDACNEVMDKVGFPRGLIRYATEAEIEDKQPFVFTGRMKAYTGVLVVLTIFLGFLLYSRGDLDSKFIKPAGATFFLRDGKISNTFTYTIINKSNKKREIKIRVLQPKGAEISMDKNQVILLKPDEIAKGNINISFPENQIKQSKEKIIFEVIDKDGKKLDDFETTFEGPFKLQI